MVDARSKEGAREGWAGILDMAAAVLADEHPTCGEGLTQHAAIPAAIGDMFDALAETLDLHRQMLRPDDANARREAEVYRDLAGRWTRIARQVQDAAARMAAQRDLPMGAHDESAWGRSILLTAVFHTNPTPLSDMLFFGGFVAAALLVRAKREADCRPSAFWLV